MPDDAVAPPDGASLAVLGAGAGGPEIARLLAHGAHDVRLWCRSPERSAQLERERRRAPPEQRRRHGVRATHRLEEALDGAEAAFVAVPSGAYAPLVASLRRRGPVPLLVSCAKGFLDADLRRLSEALAEAADRVAVLSGPNLAGEIARGLPSAATVACVDDDAARRLQMLLSQPTFRVYRSRDVIGVEANGALKNVIALAAGMSDELRLGHNTHAALVTRGLAELARLASALGGDPRTAYGLAGLGDLVATCASSESRNHQVGARIVRGESIASIEASGITAEGVTSVRHVVRFARRHDLDLPICREVEAVIDHGKAPRAAIEDLMRREPRAE